MNKDQKPQIVDDISKYELFKEKSKIVYTIGSVKKDRFIMASDKNVDDILNVYRLFDGKHTIQEIMDFYENQHKEIDVYKLLDIAEQAGLVENSKQKKVILNEFEKYGVNIFNMNFNDNYKNIFLHISKIISKPFIFLILFVVCLTFFSLPKYGSSIIKLNIYNLFDSAFISLILSTLITTISVLVHEISHAAVAAKYGLSSRMVSVSIYLFTPIIYITIPGIYSLSRGKRILVHAAGIIANTIFFGVSVISLFFVDGNIKEIMLLIAFNNLGLIIMNLVPFLPLDGYFILMNVLKIPNLRRISVKKILLIVRTEKKKFATYCIYNFISIIFVLSVIVSIISQVIYNFNLGWGKRGNLAGAIFEIRGYVLIVLVMCFSKIISYKKGSKL